MVNYGYVNRKLIHRTDNFHIFAIFFLLINNKRCKFAVV